MQIMYLCKNMVRHSCVAKMCGSCCFYGRPKQRLPSVAGLAASQPCCDIGLSTIRYTRGLYYRSATPLLASVCLSDLSWQMETPRGLCGAPKVLLGNCRACYAKTRFQNIPTAWCLCRAPIRNLSICPRMQTYGRNATICIWLHLRFPRRPIMIECKSLME